MYITLTTINFITHGLYSMCQYQNKTIQREREIRGREREGQTATETQIQKETERERERESVHLQSQFGISCPWPSMHTSV